MIFRHWLEKAIVFQINLGLLIASLQDIKWLQLTPIFLMMFLWSYCLPWWQWLVRPWPWSVDRGQCSSSQVTTSVVEGIRCCQSLMLAWMMNYIWHLCMCKCMCMCFAHSWPVHPLTHLPRADTGICLFYCQNIKANSQRGSSTASRVACHQGAAYFDRFRQSWGWQLCHSRRHVAPFYRIRT